MLAPGKRALTSGFQIVLILLIFTLFQSCRKDKDCDVITDTFQVTLTNGTMVPTAAILNADEPLADDYRWFRDAAPFLGMRQDSIFFDVGSAGMTDQGVEHFIDLEVISGSNSCNEDGPITFELFNIPRDGRAISFFDCVANLYTVVLDVPNKDPLFIADMGEIGGVGYNSRDNRLYVSGSIVANCYPNGVDVRVLVSPGRSIRDIAVDDITNTVYFAEQDVSFAQVSKFDVASPDPEFVTDQLDSPVKSMTIDADARVLYWIEEDDPFNIRRYTLPFGDVTAHVFGNQAEKGDLEADSENGLLYYSERNGAHYGIRVADLSDEEPVGVWVLENAGSAPIRGLTVDQRSNTLFWTDTPNKRIMKVNLAGIPEPEVVVNLDIEPTKIAIGLF